MPFVLIVSRLASDARDKDLLSSDPTIICALR